MLVVENQGFPIGGLVAKTQQAEVKLLKAHLGYPCIPERRRETTPWVAQSER
jgi:hypothetical protein